MIAVIGSQELVSLFGLEEEEDRPVGGWGYWG